MTEMQYLYIVSSIAEIAAEGIYVPAWNSVDWIVSKKGNGYLEMTWVGYNHIVSIKAPKDSHGSYEVGAVTWLQKD